MSDLDIHIDTDERSDRIVAACGKGSYNLGSIAESVTIADRPVFKLRDGSLFARDLAVVTCPACIDAYETAPQVVTTADLLTVVRLMQSLARRGARIGGGPDSVMQALNALEARLARPRAIPRSRPRVDRAVVDTTCGKCGDVVPAGDDCQSCYPR